MLQCVPFFLEAAARALLKKQSLMLHTSSKAYIRHPEIAAAKANRDFVLRQVTMGGRVTR
jgi:hypothetical protein